MSRTDISVTELAAVIKVDQKVVKAEKHLHRLQQQLQSGDITFTFLKVGNLCSSTTVLRHKQMQMQHGVSTSRNC
jgi:hypothetical protein